MKLGQYGNVDCAEKMMAAGADFNAVNQRGETALALAARYGHSKLVQLLLAAGIDVERTECSKPAWTSLHRCAANGFDSTVSILLDWYPQLLDHVDNRSITPLMAAAGPGHEQVLLKLLDLHTHTCACTHTHMRMHTHTCIIV